jgi:hypothetical protein
MSSGLQEGDGERYYSEETGQEAIKLSLSPQHVPEIPIIAGTPVLQRSSERSMMVRGYEAMYDEQYPCASKRTGNPLCIDSSQREAPGHLWLDLGS